MPASFTAAATSRSVGRASTGGSSESWQVSAMLSLYFRLMAAVRQALLSDLPTVSTFRPSEEVRHREPDLSDEHHSIHMRPRNVVLVDRQIFGPFQHEVADVETV